MFLAMRYNEKKGHWPLMKNKLAEPTMSDSASSKGDDVDYQKNDAIAEGVRTEVRSVGS